jgi:putative ABC transport system permease protein
MAWTCLALRRLRDDRAPTAGLLVLVLVTALVATLAPRVLARLADDAVQTEIAGVTASARNLVLQQHRRLPSGPDEDPLAEIRTAGAVLEETFPTRIQGLIADRDVVVESGRLRLQKQTSDPAFVRLRIQEGIAEHIAYLEGVPPTAAVEYRDAVGPDGQNGIPVYEAAVSSRTAAAFEISTGDELFLVGDPGDPQIGLGHQDLYAFARITGIYDVPDPEADWWLDDDLLIHPVIRALSSEIQLLDAALLIDEHSHGPLATYMDEAHRPMRYTWRSFLDAGRITGRSVPGLITSFRRLQVAYPSANVTLSGDTALRTGMRALLEGHLARWTAAESILAVMALGPALVAAATLALIAILAARRRRATMAVARSRGASPRQVLGPALAEGLLIALPAAVVATLLSVTVVPAGRLAPTVAAAAVVVGAAVSVLVATVVPIARGQGPGAQAEERDRIVLGQVAGRRLVLEGFVVALAVGAAYLLASRGVRGASSAGEVAGFDPLIAAVPALAGVAAGLVAVRVYPLPLRLVAWLARRGRGLIPVLAARRATEGGAATAVLLVLLATATVGAFAVAALDNLDRGADIASWQEVGAQYQIAQSVGALPAAFDGASLPGVEAAAGAFQATAPAGQTGPQVLYQAVEAAALAQVLAGTPADPGFPPGFTTPGDGPVPAIVSTSLAESPRGVAAGDEFEMSIEGYTLRYRVVEVRDVFAGMPLDRQWVLVPREWFRRQAPAARILPFVVYARAPADAAPALREAVAAVSPSIEVTSQAEVATAVRGSPITNAVRSGILVAALVTAAYAALGIAAALALAGLARAVEVAHLRTLGLTGRQAFGLVFAEHGPTTIAAFLAGGALGAGLFLLLRPALGLADLVGSPVTVPLVLEPAPLLLILGVMVAIVAVGLSLGAMLQRRVAPTTAIRGRFE